MPAPQVEMSSNQATSDGTIQYRAVSRLAVLALALGILSATAMVGPVLWFVPIGAIIAALVAMRRISRSDELAGWNVAFLGLLLALLFGVAAPVRAISRQYWLATRAERFGDQFLEFLSQDKPHLAHQLRERPGVRKPLTDSLPEAYQKDPESQKGFDKFIATEPVKTLLEAGNSAQIERTATEPVARDERTDLFSIHYRITLKGRNPISAVVVVKRSLDLASNQETWQIDNVAVE